MNWPKQNQLILKAFTISLLGWLTACGVKGDPLPPERPVELGRGRPTYKRATEGIPIEPVKSEEDTDQKKEKEDEVR